MIMVNYKRILTSVFGLGFLSVAPGTWGSLPSLIIFWMLASLTNNTVVTAAMLILAVTGSIICVKFSPEAITATGKKDPSEIVADELAGQAVTFLGVSFLSEYPVCITSAAGFLLFRFFDVLKPWPIRKLEKLPAGWGILLDDLLAGIYAGVILFILLKSGVLDRINGMIAG